MDKGEKDTITFDGDNCVVKTLDFCLKIKGDEYKDKKGKVLEKNLQLHAHNASGFDTWIVLNNLPCDEIIVKIKKTVKVLLKLKYSTDILRKTKNKLFNIFISDVV